MVLPHQDEQLVAKSIDWNANDDAEGEGESRSLSVDTAVLELFGADSLGDQSADGAIEAHPDRHSEDVNEGVAETGTGELGFVVELTDDHYVDDALKE